MISHRGISVITPLPFGGGEGGGASWRQNRGNLGDYAPPFGGGEGGGASWAGGGASVRRF